MRDSVIGKWFLARRRQGSSRSCSWSGQATWKQGGGVFLCWWDTGFEIVVSLGAMLGWRFYDAQDCRALASVDTVGVAAREQGAHS